jgi:hypothetical protein
LLAWLRMLIRWHLTCWHGCKTLARLNWRGHAQVDKRPGIPVRRNDAVDNHSQPHVCLVPVGLRRDDRIFNDVAIAIPVDKVTTHWEVIQRLKHVVGQPKFVAALGHDADACQLPQRLLKNVESRHLQLSRKKRAIRQRHVPKMVNIALPAINLEKMWRRVGGVTAHILLLDLQRGLGIKPLEDLGVIKKLFPVVKAHGVTNQFCDEIMAKLSDRLSNWLGEIEEDPDTVRTTHRSKAFVSIGRTNLALTASDCQKAFQSAEMVENFFDLLGRPEDAILELTDVKLETDVQDLLQEMFSQVNEH